MTTSAFLAQDDNNFSAIRYYTALDPYYYTVDNRPLQDIETNLKTSRSGGGDSARRAVALSALNLGEIASHLFMPGNTVRGMSGLDVVQVSSTTVRIMPGAVYESRNINTEVSDVTVKQALMTAQVDLNMTAPVVAGTSIIYTVEGEFIELNNTTMNTSMLPYVDAANSFLPSILLNGELRVSIKAGSAATTGSEQPPVTTAGRIPLYNLTLTQGSSTFTVSTHANAPYSKGLAKAVNMIPLTTGGATTSQINNVPVFTMANGATSGVVFGVNGIEDDFNPTKPLKLKITFSPTATGGGATFRIRYNAYTAGELITSGVTSTASDTVTVTAVANGIQSYTTTTAVIPPSVLSSFVGGRWSVVREYVNIVLERLGADANDTNTGDINVISVMLVQ